MLYNKKSYIKSDKPIPGRDYRCSMCGYPYPKREGSFTPSRSPLYIGNSGFLTICKSCVNKLYSYYIERFGGDTYETIKRLCMIFDIYFCDELFECAEKSEGCTSLINSYLARVNLIPYRKKTFDDYLYSE